MVFQPTSRSHSHHATRYSDHLPERYCHNPRVKWGRHHPHIRKERQCVGHSAGASVTSPILFLLLSMDRCSLKGPCPSQGSIPEGGPLSPPRSAAFDPADC